MNNGKTILPSFETKFIEINNKNIDELGKMSEIREIRNSQVNKILNQLNKGEHFDTTISVNERNGKYRIIDGMHRKEAISRWIKSNKNNKIKVEFHIYKNLTDEEERIIYRKLNIGLRQTADDYIKVHKQEIPILKMMEKKFPKETPIRIYKLQQNQLGWHFGSLLKAYLTATKKPFPDFVVYTANPETFLEDLKNLTERDYSNIEQFTEFFVNAFGTAGYSNKYQTTTGLNCLITLFLDNNIIARTEKEKFVNLFKNKINGDSDILVECSKGGRTATVYAYTKMRNKLEKDRFGKNLRFREI